MEMAQLAMSAAPVMLTALGLELANVPRKVLMQQVGGQMETLDMTSVCAVRQQFNQYMFA